jgi:hypothetical protein
MVLLILQTITIRDNILLTYARLCVNRAGPYSPNSKQEVLERTNLPTFLTLFNNAV